MASTIKVTINDIIQRNSFQHARVIAGSEGLTNQVKWTHILETDKFESLINGGELILTTGVGLKLDSPEGLVYLRSLINRNAAGICVEIGTHVEHISKEIIALANQSHFPIIIFERFVKFVDITQDLHSIIINKHHQILNQINELSAMFNELSLLPNGTLKILEKIHARLKGDVLYITDETKSYYFPPKSKDIEEKIRIHLTNMNHHLENKQYITVEEDKFAITPVKGLGQTWGYLCLQVQENILEDFLFSVLDRASLAIAQIMLRNRTVEERKQHVEGNIVRNLLQGENNDTNELHATIPLISGNFSYRLILIDTSDSDTFVKEEDWNEIKPHRAVMFRSLLKQHGFSSAISVIKNNTAVIVFISSDETYQQQMVKFSHVVKALRKLYSKDIFNGCTCSFGISKLHSDIHSFTTSNEEARKVLYLKRINITPSIFYEKIGIYRLLLSQPREDLQSYVDDYLQPLIDHDNETNSELLRTLEIYLGCRGSKKEAAERLYIVRQTLYHRLNKIEELLGEDFLEPNNLLALETAIRAYYIPLSSN